MIWELPTTLEVGGIERNIRTDFRDILRILCAFEDPDLEDREKILVCLTVLYEDIEEIPSELYQEAMEKAKEFIDHGASKKEDTTRTMDWEQDADLIFPAINAAAGREVREMDYLHWWTFLGFFMSIDRKSTYATVLSIRTKKAKGKKLEKWEREFWSSNQDICRIRKKLSQEEIAERERLNALLND